MPMMDEASEGDSLNSRIEHNSGNNIDEIAKKLQKSFIHGTDDGGSGDVAVKHYFNTTTQNGHESDVQSPSEFNEVNHLFHIDFMRLIQSIPVQQKRLDTNKLIFFSSPCKSFG